MKVVIIIPTYNERGNIERLIEILENKVFSALKKHSINILVVDDNSPDGTAEQVKQLIKKWNNISIIEGKKHGLGAAYVRGMTFAIEKMGAELLFEIDADLSHDPHKIPEFLRKIDEGYDMAVGTRYSQGGSIPRNWSLSRKLFSIFGNLLVRSILMRFKIHDWTGGFRVLRKEVFLKEKHELVAFRGYTFQVSFLHKAVKDGFKIAEVPINFTDRTLGRSKIAPREYITDLLKYIVRARAIEILHSSFLKYGITGFVGYAINAVSLEFFYNRGFHPAVAGAIGAELSIIWNFVVNNLWSFNKHKITNPAKLLFKFPQFNLVAMGSLIIISSIIGIGTHLFGAESRQLFLIIAVGFFVVPYSYSMYNIFIWKRWRIPF